MDFNIAVMVILQYIDKSVSCSNIPGYLKSGNKILVVRKQEKIVELVKCHNIDVIIYCCCSASESELKTFLKIKKEVHPTPIIVCSTFPDPQMISELTLQGIENFMLCSMSRDRIRSVLKKAIQNNDMRLTIEELLLPSSYSPYKNDIIFSITHTSPSHLNIKKLASTLDISVRWTQTIIKNIFGMTLTQLKRKLITNQAVSLMKATKMDNTEIALKIGYSDENSLYRIFRKELGYGPNQAREHLYDETSY